MSLTIFLALSCAAIDGDTLTCGSIGRVRLIGIDAPEMAGHCRQGRQCTPGDAEASKAELARMVNRRTVRCVGKSRDRYGRILARCSVFGVDLSCSQIAGGFAVRRYGRIRCR